VTPRFTPAERSALLAELVSAARDDPRVVAAALVGSAALGRTDEWSDIDLALSVDAAAEVSRVVEDWTGRMSAHGVADHLDVRAGPALFRVFLLANTLQVDLSFWPPADFGATGPKFRLLFGSAAEPVPAAPPAATGLIGWGWLYALHVRSSIERGRAWQAVHMLNGMRDQVIALRCLRHGLPTDQGRGVDDLPAELTASLPDTLPRSLERSALDRAFAATVTALLAECDPVSADLAARLRGPLGLLAVSSASAR
jgi:Nucleotidyltransferase domain